MTAAIKYPAGTETRTDAEIYPHPKHRSTLMDDLKRIDTRHLMARDVELSPKPAKEVIATAWIFNITSARE